MAIFTGALVASLRRQQIRPHTPTSLVTEPEIEMRNSITTSRRIHEQLDSLHLDIMNWNTVRPAKASPIDQQLRKIILAASAASPSRPQVAVISPSIILNAATSATLGVKSDINQSLDMPARGSGLKQWESGYIVPIGFLHPPQQPICVGITVLCAQHIPFLGLGKLLRTRQFQRAWKQPIRGKVSHLRHLPLLQQHPTHCCSVAAFRSLCSALLPR
mmetsp:Transcript_26867/g.64686  ORF Transcript_26867/g.64686 Transcript_26867/m.64686 type:complete len:217 (-) Transcript_26867:637-1287(-)